MFLNPLMLFGIAAVSIPIAIHLLNKRKFKRVRWAAMRFVMEAVKRNQRQLQIEDLLLLALRCAIVVLLAVALARPALQAAASAGLFGRRNVTTVIIVDNSYSMGATDGVQPRFEQAKLAATEIIDSLPAGSSAAIFLAANGYEPVIPEPTFDLNLARKTIDELKLSDRSTDLLPSLRAGIEMLESRDGGELYLITDAQQLGWRQLEQARTLLKDAGRKVSTQIIFVGSPAEENVGISDLRLASGLAPVDQPLRFEAQVTNYGLQVASNVRVTLRIGDEPPSDEALIDRIPPGESRSVSLFARLRRDAPSAHHSITATLASADALQADNRRTLAVRALTSVSVLLVDGDVTADPRNSETFFLRHALQPVPPAEQQQYFIQVRTIQPVELESTRLDPYDAVILANVADVTDRTIENFAAYLRRGGRGIILFPGPQTLAWSFNDRMFKANAMLPAELGEPVGDATQDQTFVTFATDALTHPIARLWTDPASGSIASAHFYRYFPLIPDQRNRAQLPNDAGAAAIVLRFNDAQKTPAVMERDWGFGKVVLFASTADTGWNDLPVRPGLFVPLLHRTLGSIIQRQDEHLNVAVGQPFAQRVDVDLLRREARIRPAGGGEHDVVSRTIELIDGQAILRFENTGTAGAYEVTLSDDRPPMLFAAQRDPVESNLQPLTEDQIRQLAESARIVRWGDGQEFGQRLTTARTGFELWMPLALVVLLLAAAETFVAQWFSRSR